MRNELVITTVLIVCGARVAPTLYADQAKSSARAESATQALAGTWTAPVYEVPLSSQLDVSVWGPKATLRRNVELVLEASGEGVLTVRTAVLDERGRTKAGSQSIAEARIRIEMPDGEGERGMQPTVTVVSAERRYPDDPNYRWPLDGLSVKLSTVESDPNMLNFRFDTPEGTGSFGDSLYRKRSRTAR